MKRLEKSTPFFKRKKKEIIENRDVNIIFLIFNSCDYTKL